MSWVSTVVRTLMRFLRVKLDEVKLINKSIVILDMNGLLLNRRLSARFDKIFLSEAKLNITFDLASAGVRLRGREDWTLYCTSAQTWHNHQQQSLTPFHVGLKPQHYNIRVFSRLSMKRWPTLACWSINSLCSSSSFSASSWSPELWWWVDRYTSPTSLIHSIACEIYII